MPTVTRPRRKRLDPLEAREVVLAAAEYLLKTSGPAALRLGEIAAHAGLSHSNVLYHFESMHELEARLGERIAVRLAEDIALVYRGSDGNIPIEAANARLFAVISETNYAQLVWWMLFTSNAPNLEALGAKLRLLCDVICAHPALGRVPKRERRKRVLATTQLAVCAALGYGLVGPRLGALFGDEAAPSALPAALSRLIRSNLATDTMEHA